MVVQSLDANKDLFWTLGRGWRNLIIWLEKKTSITNKAKKKSNNDSSRKWMLADII
jgi:hypothetical protein